MSGYVHYEVKPEPPDYVPAGLIFAAVFALFFLILMQ